jgi:hypothetical protein
MVGVVGSHRWCPVRPIADSDVFTVKRMLIWYSSPKVT